MFRAMLIIVSTSIGIVVVGGMIFLKMTPLRYYCYMIIVVVRSFININIVHLGSLKY